MRYIDEICIIDFPENWLTPQASSHVFPNPILKHVVDVAVAACMHREKASWHVAR